MQQNQLPILPKKITSKRKGRTGTILTTSNSSLAPQSISMTNLRPKNMDDQNDSIGNSDPLPRRKYLSASFPIPPPLPPPRPTISHSKSLTTVSLNSHKICTEV